ncbi:MAG: hypothetical protein EBR46_02170, partial [Betaproteobacteria bacterium]|nr:hypothetical protein [Betaproteobacteria bacterium]
MHNWQTRQLFSAHLDIRLGRRSTIDAKHPVQGLGIKPLRSCKGPQVLVAGRRLAGGDHRQLRAEVPSHQRRHGHQGCAGLVI